MCACYISKFYFTYFFLSRILFHQLNPGLDLSEYINLQCEFNFATWMSVIRPSDIVRHRCWKYLFSLLRNGNVDIARSEDFLPSRARVALVCVHEDPVFLAYNVPVWNSYRSLGGAIRLSRLSSNLLDSARLKLVFGLLWNVAPARGYTDLWNVRVASESVSFASRNAMFSNRLYIYIEPHMYTNAY